ncbi:MAG: hypothetical protein WBP40_00075 [Candidatus Moraniibacteriota bacterium]
MFPIHRAKRLNFVEEGIVRHIVEPRVAGDDGEPDRLGGSFAFRNFCRDSLTAGAGRNLADTARECSDEIPTPQEVLAKMARAKAVAQ